MQNHTTNQRFDSYKISTRSYEIKNPNLYISILLESQRRI